MPSFTVRGKKSSSQTELLVGAQNANVKIKSPITDRKAGMSGKCMFTICPLESHIPLTEHSFKIPLRGRRDDSAVS